MMINSVNKVKNINIGDAICDERMFNAFGKRYVTTYAGMGCVLYTRQCDYNLQTISYFTHSDDMIPNILNSFLDGYEEIN